MPLIAAMRYARTAASCFVKFDSRHGTCRFVALGCDCYFAQSEERAMQGESKSGEIPVDDTDELEIITATFETLVMPEADASDDEEKSGFDPYNNSGTS